MEVWIPITIAAAFCQNVRTALQKHMSKSLSTGGATYIRFLYALPFAYIYVFGLHEYGDFPFYAPNWTFGGYVVVGGLAQILATAFLVKLFSLRNFAVGTTYSKTETVQAAFIGLILLGDTLTLPAILAIIVSFMGIILISVSGSKITLKEVVLGWTGKPALYGLASGGLFGICAVCYRGAGLSLGGEGAVMQAATSIVWVLTFQATAMTAYILVKERAQFMLSLHAWRMAVLVGLFSMLGSIGWFTAMTLQNAAYVRAVGQIELIFTFSISYFVFRERTTLFEALGVFLIAIGILFLVLPW